MKSPKPNRVAGTAAPAFGGQDILYAISRHRWMIIILSGLGIAAAVATLVLSKRVYSSEARILVKYIVENRSLTVDDPTSEVRTPREDNVVNTELGILSSLDLAKEVAREVGPTNVVPEPDKDMEPLIAATVAIRKGLDVETAAKSTIIQLRFQHADPSVARSVLTNLVAAYLRMHSRIHRSPDFLNDLHQEAEKRRSSLDQVAEDLRRIKSELSVSSIEEARKAFQEEIARTRREISMAETLLAEKHASLGALGGQASPVAPGPETAPSETVSRSTNAVPPERMAEYRNLRLRIEELTRREQTLLLEYTDLSPFVQAVRQRLATNEAALTRLQEEYPTLSAPSSLPMFSAEAATATTRGPQPALEIPAIDARLKSLNSQLVKLRADAAKLDEREAEFENLSRRKQIEEKRYLHIASAVGQADIDQAMTRGRLANISVIQQPTFAAPVRSTILKLAAGMAGGGIAMAFALAFAIELVADQTLRRRSQVEQSLQVPVFLTVPRLQLRKPRGRARRVPAPGDRLALPAGAPSDSPADVANDKTRSDPRAGMDAGGEGMAQYVEALRDRLIMHFESEGLERKPKLVGLTSCGHGAGVTTLATSLAASLSETGDGNVLYVDMNPHRGPSVLPFQRGESKIALAEAFEGETRAAAQVQENLYVVSMAEPGSRRVGVIPKALAALMPKMKASDYDYIIFDFPPVTQTSVTAKVAGLLDMTFLVVESEKTQSELARNAVALMGEGRARVSAVLNKHRRYVPKSYDSDL